MVIFENDDIEAWIIISIFKRLQFTYGMSSKPIGYNYEALKDSIKWAGLKPKKYVPLITNMFRTYCQNLPSE